MSTRAARRGGCDIRLAAVALAAMAFAPGCQGSEGPRVDDLRLAAERYFTAVYGCGPECLPALVSDGVVVSFLRFDARGRVVAEVGEESTPGPMARISR